MCKKYDRKMVPKKGANCDASLNLFASFFFQIKSAGLWFGELKLALESSADVFHCKHIYGFWMKKSGKSSSAWFAGSGTKMCDVQPWIHFLYF